MAGLKERYELASQDIACEEFDGEMVVLNLASGHYFALNSSASFLMNGLLKGHAIEELASVEGAPFALDDARQFLDDLLQHGLLAACPSCQAVPLDGTIAESVHSLTDKPVLEVHDDLADLIIADPVHDTDQSVGWPAVPDAA